jgi:hypothetical protein
VHAENAHRAFSRGNVGDHIQLLHVFQVKPARPSGPLTGGQLAQLNSINRRHCRGCCMSLTASY